MKLPNSKWSGTSAQTLKDGDTIKEWTIGPNKATMITKTMWRSEIASTGLKYGPYKTRTRAKAQRSERISDLVCPTWAQSSHLKGGVREP